MAYTEHEQLVRDLWKAFHDLRWQDAQALLHEGFAAEWPQSGERFCGPANFIAMNRAYPGKFKIKVLRTSCAEGRVISEVLIAPGEGKPVFAISFFEFRHGKIFKAVEYWGDACDAPAWRSQWAERF